MHRASRHSEEAALNRALPYAASLPAEAAASLDAAASGLRTALAIGDFQRGAPHALRQLALHLQRKHDLADQERRALILDAHAAVCHADLPASTRAEACVVLSGLLRRGKHLNVSLGWRPLWRLLLAAHLPEHGPVSYESRSVAASHRVELARCVARCRSHFAAGEAQAMLDAAAALLCPHDASRFFLGASLLALFLPSHGDAAACWLPAVLRLWLSCGVDGSAEYDALWLGLLARLAKDAFYGHASPVEWAPHLPLLYSRALRLLRLPGGQEAGAELRPAVVRPLAEACELVD